MQYRATGMSSSSSTIISLDIIIITLLEGGLTTVKSEMEMDLGYSTHARIPPEQNPNRVLNDIYRLLINLWL